MEAQAAVQAAGGWFRTEKAGADMGKGRVPRIRAVDGEIHLEQFVGYTHSNFFAVYRAQGLTRVNIVWLIKTKDDLLLFNNFLEIKINLRL